MLDKPHLRCDRFRGRGVGQKINAGHWYSGGICGSAIFISTVLRYENLLVPKSIVFSGRRLRLEVRCIFKLEATSFFRTKGSSSQVSCMDSSELLFYIFVRAYQTLIHL